MKRYDKGLLFQKKAEEVYKILTTKELRMETNSLFKKVEPHKKFNTEWGIVYGRDLAEFAKEELMAMCPKDVVDICVLRRDDGDMLMDPPIIKLELKKKHFGPTYNHRRRNYPFKN